MEDFWFRLKGKPTKSFPLLSQEDRFVRKPVKLGNWMDTAHPQRLEEMVDLQEGKSDMREKMLTELGLGQ